MINTIFKYLKKVLRLLGSTYIILSMILMPIMPAWSDTRDDNASPDFEGPGGIIADKSVDTASGKVRFSIPLATLPSSAGPGYSVDIKYDSTGVEAMSQVWSAELQSSTVGTGWALSHPSAIRRDTRSTGQTRDDRFLFKNILLELVSTADGVSTYRARKLHTLNTFKFYAPEEGSPSYWVVTDPSGKKFTYGGDSPQTIDPKTIKNSALKNIYDILTTNSTPAESNAILGSVSYGVKWGPWIGAAYQHKFQKQKQEQLPIAWHLKSIEDQWGNKTDFQYVQHVQNVGGDQKAKWYTKATYLYRVDSPSKRSIQFWYCSRTQESQLNASSDCDNIVGQRYADFEDPWVKNTEPDAYQELYEVMFLGHVRTLTNGDDESTVQHLNNLTYEYFAPGRDARMAKLMLKKITPYFVSSKNSAETLRKAAPSHSFDYYGESDGLKVTIAGADRVSGLDNQKIFDPKTGALYGALKTHTSPLGAQTTYKYAQNILQNIHRDIKINTKLKTKRKIQYGNGYAVAYANEGAFLYTWSKSGWIEQDIGTILQPDDSLNDSPIYLGTNHLMFLDKTHNLFIMKKDRLSGLWQPKKLLDHGVTRFSASERLAVAYVQPLTKNVPTTTPVHVFFVGDDNPRKLDSPFSIKGWSASTKLGSSFFYVVANTFPNKNFYYAVYNEKEDRFSVQKSFALDDSGANLGGFKPETYDESWDEAYAFTPPEAYKNVLLTPRKEMLLVQYPLSLHTETTVQSGNSTRILRYQYDQHEETFTFMKQRYPDQHEFYPTPIVGDEEYEDFRAFSSANDWGVNHAVQNISWSKNFSGGRNNLHKLQVCSFSGQGPQVYEKSHDDTGNAARCDTGSFYQSSPKADVFSSLDSAQQANYYRFDPKTAQWYSIGNSSNPTFPTIKPAPEWVTIFDTVLEVLTYAMMVGGAILQPETIFLDALYIAPLFFPGPSASISPGSFSIGEKYLNDADDLWYITHDGKLSPLGSDTQNRASVLTGFPVDYSLTSHGSLLGSTFAPFTASKSNQWGSYLRILRNGQLGKYVLIRGGKDQKIQIYSDRKEKTTNIHGNLFITYVKNNDQTLESSQGDWFLHNVLQDNATGEMYDYAVSSVHSDDGLNTYSINYEYNTQKVALPYTYGEVTAYLGDKNKTSSALKIYRYTGDTKDPQVMFTDGSVKKSVAASDVLSQVIGKIHRIEQYDSTNSSTPFATQDNRHLVNNKDDLNSAHLLQTSSQQNGVTTMTEYTYHPTSRQTQITSHTKTAPNLLSILNKQSAQPEQRTQKIFHRYAWEDNTAMLDYNLYNPVALQRTQILINGAPSNAPDSYKYIMYKDWNQKGAYDVYCHLSAISDTSDSTDFSSNLISCAPPINILPPSMKWEPQLLVLERTSTGKIIQSQDPRTSSYHTNRYFKRFDADYLLASFMNKNDLSGSSTNHGLNFYTSAESYEDLSKTGLTLSSVNKSTTAFSGAASFLFERNGSISYNPTFPRGLDQSIVYGFWAKRTNNDANALCSFGAAEKSQQFKVGDAWRYYQYTLPTNKASGFTIKCSPGIVVDDIYAQTASGNFSAPVYNLDRMLVTDHATSSGHNIHHRYDPQYPTLQTSFSTANDGSGDILPAPKLLAGWSRWSGAGIQAQNEKEAYDPSIPNVHYTLAAPNYHDAKYIESGQTISINDLGESFNFTIYTNIGISEGQKIELTDTNNHKIELSYGPGSALTLNIDGTSTKLPLPSVELSEISLTYINGAFMVWASEKLLFSKANTNINTISKLTANITHNGAIFYKNPRVASTHRDAFGRVFQTHRLASNFNNTPITVQDTMQQNIYDGWGNAAVRTKISAPNTLSKTRCANYNEELGLLAYCDSLVTNFNWKTFKTQGITGATADYWNEETDHLAFDANTDGAFSFMAKEFSSLSRLVATSRGYAKIFGLDGALGENTQNYNSTDAKSFFQNATAQALRPSLDIGFQAQTQPFSVAQGPRSAVNVQTMQAKSGKQFHLQSTGVQGHTTHLISTASGNVFPKQSGAGEKAVVQVRPNGIKLSQKATNYQIFKIDRSLVDTNPFSKSSTLVSLYVIGKDGRRKCIGISGAAQQTAPSIVSMRACPTSSEVPSSIENWEEQYKTPHHANPFFSMKAPSTNQTSVAFIAPVQTSAYRSLVKLDQTGVFSFLVEKPFLAPKNAVVMRADNAKLCLMAVKSDDYHYQNSTLDCDKTTQGLVYNKAFQTQTESFYMGRALAHQETDSKGILYQFFDTLGRLRFSCENYTGTKEVSNGCQYKKYDFRGRVTEEGTLKNTSGDAKFYAEKALEQSFPTDQTKCVQKTYFYDAALDFSQSTPVVMSEKTNMLGRLFAIRKAANNIPDKPTTSCGENTQMHVINYQWNKGNQWDGMNVAGSALSVDGTTFKFRNAYYQNQLNAHTLAYPDRDTQQFEILDSQKRVMHVQNPFGKTIAVCNPQANACKNYYAKSHQYYLDGTLKSYTFNDEKLKYERVYDRLMRLREIKVTHTATPKDVLFSEKIAYERNTSGQGYQAGNIIQTQYSGEGFGTWGHSYDYHYDPLGRFTNAIRNPIKPPNQLESGSIGLAVFGYEYDDNGNILYATVEEPSSTDLGYTQRQVYSYNKNTNQLSTLVDNASNTALNFSYGANDSADNNAGAITSIKQTGTSTSTINIQRNAKNQKVLSIQKAGGKATKYDYDAFGRRISETSE